MTFFCVFILLRLSIYKTLVVFTVHLKYFTLKWRKIYNICLISKNTQGVQNSSFSSLKCGKFPKTISGHLSCAKNSILSFYISKLSLFNLTEIWCTATFFSSEQANFISSKAFFLSLRKRWFWRSMIQITSIRGREGFNCWENLPE